MYCSTCGKSLNENLNYCNSCGSRIEKNALTVSNNSARLLSVAAGCVAIVGIICFIPLLERLLVSRLDPPAVIVILIAYLVTVFLMFAVMIGHVWKHSGDFRIKGARQADDYEAPNSFRGINTAQLEEPRQPVMSVTDHTTRTLDKVPAVDR